MSHTTTNPQNIEQARANTTRKASRTRGSSWIPMPHSGQYLQVDND
jgi:hypothetical protein